MKQLLTVNQLAHHFNVSRDTIYRWLRQGMPFEKLPSGNKRFDLEKVNEWNKKGAR